MEKVTTISTVSIGKRENMQFFVINSHGTSDNNSYTITGDISKLIIYVEKQTLFLENFSNLVGAGYGVIFSLAFLLILGIMVPVC